MFNESSNAYLLGQARAGYHLAVAVRRLFTERALITNRQAAEFLQEVKTRANQAVQSDPARFSFSYPDEQMEFDAGAKDTLDVL